MVLMIAIALMILGIVYFDLYVHERAKYLEGDWMVWVMYATIRGANWLGIIVMMMALTELYLKSKA